MPINEETMREKDVGHYNTTNNKAIEDIRLRPGAQFSAIVYDDKHKVLRALANTLEICDYLLQNGARVDIVNDTRHSDHYGKK